MMRFLVAGSFLLLQFLAFSQKKNTGTLVPVELEWTLLTNNFNKEFKALNQLKLTNTGKKEFPASGWTIYFSCSREAVPTSANGWRIEHVNGDLYRLFPVAGAAPLKKGQSNSFQYPTIGSSLNHAAAPNGIYLVWDKEPMKGYNLAAIKHGPFSDTTIQYVSNEQQFDKFAAASLKSLTTPAIIPAPAKMVRGTGSFSFDAATTIFTDAAFGAEANYLSQQGIRLFGKALAVSSANPDRKGAILLKKNTLTGEAYELSVQPDGVVISAGTGAGIFYGIQSLQALIPAVQWKNKAGTIQLQEVQIQDAPRFGFRSLMIDIARNFQPKQELLRMLDLMSIYKLNALHLHFNDDEGWRIEMPSFPELTSIGSQRGHPLDSKNNLPPSYGAGPETGKLSASGFYSRADFIELLQYAKTRHIQIIPEIETPGHARAAIKSMDARYRKFMAEGNKAEALKYLLRDTMDQSKYSTAQAWTDNVMCVALPSVYTFIEQVVDDITGIYKEAGAPLTTIHMGGDEVPAGVWEGSPECKALIEKDPALENADDLWYYYFTKVQKILEQRGLELSGWEEAGMRKTKLQGQPKLIVNPRLANEGYRLHVWNNMVGWGNEDLPYRLANAGYKVILSPVSNNYFDMAYLRSPEEPGYYWGGFTDVDKPFYFIPYDYFRNTKEDAAGNPVKADAFVGKDRLTDFGKSNIVGLQGLIWSETIRSEANLEYMILPKLLGLAERAWAKDPEWATTTDAAKAAEGYAADWNRFANQLGQQELPKLDYYAGGFAYRVPPPGMKIENGKMLLNVQFPGMKIRYTTDGSEPTEKSMEYSGPIEAKGIIKAKTFTSSGRASRTVSN
jgi:hexosaminidase